MDCLYTEDWLMASKGTKVAPAQGGFLLIKPSTSLFYELQAIVQGELPCKLKTFSNSHRLFYGGHSRTLHKLMGLPYTLVFDGAKLLSVYLTLSHVAKLHQ